MSFNFDKYILGTPSLEFQTYTVLISNMAPNFEIQNSKEEWHIYIVRS